MNIDTIKQLIRIASTADRPSELTAAVDLVAAQLAPHPNITCERFMSDGKPSLLAYAGATRPKTFRVLLNGHVDVVPATPEQSQPVVRDDKLYGRGALDMKSAALVLTEVFCNLAPTLKYPLGLQIVSDEEIGGHNGTKYQIEQGVQADFVIAGEFTQPAQICTHARGICQVRVSFAGKAAHGAYVWDGDNAAVHAAGFVQKLLQAYPIPKAETWQTTINVAEISTPGATLNRVPGAAEVYLDCRYVPGDPHFANARAAAKFMRSLSPGCQPTVTMFEPAQATDTENPDVQQLAAALKTVTGKQATCIKKPGGSDARFYSAQGKPAVVFGLQGKGLHGDEEYVELASLKIYQSILEKFLQQIDSAYYTS